MLKTFGRAASLTALTLLAIRDAQAQDVKTVIGKTNAVYQNIKSLQGTYETSMAGGAQGSATIMTDVKLLAGKKASINVQPVGKGVGQIGTAFDASSQRIVDDGVNMYAYIPKQNKYMKQPHNANVVLQQVAALYGLPFLSGKNVNKLLAPSKIDGKPVYVVEVTAPNGTGKGRILISIDQVTYHIKQNKLIMTNGAKSGELTTTVKSETLNGAIPNSAFVFTPPKGATEVKPQPRPSMGAPGAAPGGARPGPAPGSPRPGGVPGKP